MSIFDSLGQRGPRAQQPQQMTRQQMEQMQRATGDALRQLQRDPNAMLQQAGLSVPAGMTDAEQMVRHILDSGQVTGPRAQMARSLMQRMGLR